MSMRIVENHPVVKKQRKKTMRGFRRKESLGYAKEFISRVELKEVHSPGGVYLGQFPVFTTDDNRILDTITRIAKGLYYEEGKGLIPDGFITTARFIRQEVLNDENIKIVLNELASINPRIVGDDVLAYSMVSTPENRTAFMIRFYGKLLFFAVIGPESDLLLGS